jgi:hypothetical protein
MSDSVLRTRMSKAGKETAEHISETSSETYVQAWVNALIPPSD